MYRLYIALLVGLFNIFSTGADGKTMSHDTPKIGSFSGACDRQSDSLALVDFYFATGGNQWFVDWDFTEPIDLWYGVSLNAEGCVESINMSDNNNLTGTIPDLNLPNCRFINLSNNKLSGQIPNFTHLSIIVNINLDNNQIEGTLPVFNMPILQSFSAKNNKIGGELTGFINAANLLRLDLSYNQLTGTIPFLTNLNNLQILNLNNNQLTGQIPNFITLSQLRELHLENNFLTGTIPNFSVLQNLSLLDLSNNQIAGAIPDFPTLRRLHYLDLSNNQLTGQVPNFTSLDSLSELMALNNNRLTGVIPDFSELKQLYELRVQNNEFTDMFPLDQMDALTVLSAQNNKLTFEDILPNSLLPVPVFYYSPQAKVGQLTYDTLNIGESYTMTIDIDNGISNNRYIWFKDGVFLTQSSNNFYTIPYALPDNQGVYTCQVTNPGAPGLTLYSEDIHITVNFNNTQFNDECYNATAITQLNGECNTFTLEGATPDLFNGTCFEGVNNVWFKFIAQGSSIIINTTPHITGLTEIALFKFDPFPCSPGTSEELGCDILSLNYTGLVVGQEYYIMVAYRTNDEGEFDICVNNPLTPPVPPNDRICNAYALSPNGYCEIGTTVGALPDQLNPNCNDLTARTVWYKIRLSEKKNQLNLNLSTINIGGNISVIVFRADSCQGTLSPVPNGIYCGPPNTAIVLTGLAEETYYYIQVGTTLTEQGSFRICATEVGTTLQCGENRFCDDTPNGPAFISTVSGKGGSCLNGCNIGAVTNQFISGTPCFKFNTKTVWYRIESDAQADLLSVSINSSFLKKLKVAVLQTTNCVNFENIACNVGQNGEVVLNFVEINPNQTYYIAVTDALNDEGTFNICVSTDSKSNECNISSELIVTQASMGSPLSGPFLPGEQVTFCYTVDNWNKSKCNKLQGIVPEFGDGWDRSSFSAFGRPLDITEDLDAHQDGRWQWFSTVDQVLYKISNPNNGYPINTILPSGWFFLNDHTPLPNNPIHPNSSLGDGYDCPPYNDASTWRVCFNLDVRPATNCVDSNNLAVKIKTFADSETGVNTEIACLNDKPAYFNSYILCCKAPLITNPLVADTICSGSSLSFGLFSDQDPDVTFSWEIEGNTGIDSAKAGYGPIFRQTLYNKSNDLRYVDFSIKGDAITCEGIPSLFRVYVRPENKAIISGNTTACEGDSTTLQINLSGEPPFAFVLNQNGMGSDTFKTSNTLYFVKVLPTDQGVYKVHYFKDANCTGVASGEVKINLLPASVRSLFDSICYGATYQFMNETFDQSGVYDFDAGAGQNGCDSIVRLTLTEFSKINVQDSVITGSQGSNQGSISPNITGGLTPYTYKWSTGSTQSSINNLASGNYTLTLTDAFGCSEVFSFHVPDFISVVDLTRIFNQISIYPNPIHSANTLILDINAIRHERVEARYLDMYGRAIKNERWNLSPGQNKLNSNLSGFIPGIYTLVISNEKLQTMYFKIVVQ